MTGLALSVKTAAAEADVSQDTIRIAINKGRLPAYKVGDKASAIRIMRDDLEAWLRSTPVGADEEPES